MCIDLKNKNKSYENFVVPSEKKKNVQRSEINPRCKVRHSGFHVASVAPLLAVIV